MRCAAAPPQRIAVGVAAKAIRNGSTGVGCYVRLNGSPTNNATNCSTSSPQQTPAGDIAAAWIAKELLRDVLACTARGGLRYEISAPLYTFYTFSLPARYPRSDNWPRRSPPGRNP